MSAAETPIVIPAARRTPLGSLKGAFASTPATQLGATAIRATLSDSGLAPERVSEVLTGCVLPAGLGQTPPQQAAGLPVQTGATTVDKVCGSGMKALILGHDLTRARSAETVVGGMEAMSGALYLLPEMRLGHKVGTAEVIDHMMNDGMEVAYDKGRPMGAFGEATAERYGFDRAAQDAYAVETLTRARRGVESGAFDAECAPVTFETRTGPQTISRDERLLQIDTAKIPGLRGAFGKDGTITAASASANADGAAALILTGEATASADGLPVMARILGHATHSQEPEWFTTAPIPAIRKLMAQVGWSVADVDLFEINEAFAVVAMAAAAEIGIPRDRLNVNGGACALGRTTFLGNPDVGYLNPMGLIHGGWAMTLLDSALGCAVHSTLERGETFASIGTETKFIRPIVSDTGQVTCTAEVQSRGRGTATASGRVEDRKGRLLATGTTTCFIRKAA